MKSLFVVFCLILPTFVVYAQINIKDTIYQNCDFTKSLHFVNGKAIVKIEAIYHDLHEDAPIYAIKGFQKHKFLLNTRIYSGAGILFSPVNCNKKYDTPFTAKINCCSFAIGSTVYLTCTVFSDYPGNDSKYFFVVSGLSLTDPNKKATPK
jgi:hypothetical protein